MISRKSGSIVFMSSIMGITTRQNGATTSRQNTRDGADEGGRSGPCAIRHTCQRGIARRHRHRDGKLGYCRAGPRGVRGANEVVDGPPGTDGPSPSAVADAVAWLASDEAEHITGAQLVIDAGTMLLPPMNLKPIVD